MRAPVYWNPVLARGDAAWQGGGVPSEADDTAIGAMGTNAVDGDQQIAEARAAPTCACFGRRSY